ncbi:MAG: HK97 gp10 family phage protein [Nitrososphaerales archaeon]
MIHDWIDSKKAFTPRTGNLQQSIQIRFDSNKAVISANASYASYVEFGTKPHLILPKNRQALKIPTRDGFIFIKKVRHPGSKPYPYFFADFENRKREVAKAFMEGLLS